MVRITVAGRVGVERVGGESAERSLPAGQVRLTFAVLVLERDRAVSRHELADLLWPSNLPPTWDAALRNIITRLRQALAATDAGREVAVVNSKDGYEIQVPEGTTVDIEEARADVADGVRLRSLGQPAAAAARFGRAAQTLARLVLPGVEGMWADGIRDSCRSTRVHALELLTDAMLIDQQPSEAVATAEAALALGPFRESAHRLLMRAHAANGNRAEALRAYSRCRQLLTEELGVGPSPETEQDYLELLLIGDGDGGGGALVEAPGEEATVNAVATRREDLLGRDAELAEAAAAIAEGQVTSISGPGGVGKTRLASAYAESAVDRFPGGIHWVELLSVGEPGVAAAVATAVSGESIGVDPLDATVTALGGSTALVVLDNCEHVIDEAARVTSAIVRGCRSVRVLATTRVPLGVGGERVIRLQPLELPADAGDAVAVEQSPAVALFVRRAAEVRRDFALGPANTAAVVEICRRLDGLPLAIELAASLVRLMPVADIASRLDDRFRLLRTSRRDIDVRHHSLGDVIAWSYDLLGDDERALFDKICAFPGSFSLAGAHAVAGEDGDELDTLTLLTGLVDQSIVVAVGDEEARYALLESVREYGRAKLEAGPAGREARDRIVDFAIRFAAAAADGVRGAHEAQWVARLDAELATLTAAFRWAADDGQPARCVELVVSLFDYAFHRIRHEVGVLASDAVLLPGARSHPSFPDLLAAAGYLEWQRGLARDAEEHIAQSLALRDGWLGLDALGTISMFQGDVSGAIVAYARAATLAEGDPYLTAISQAQRAFAAVYDSRPDAPELAALAEAAAVDAGNPTAMAMAAWATGVVLMDADPEFALLRFERCIALASAVRNRLAHGSASVPGQEMRTRLERRSAFEDARGALAEIRYMKSTGNDATQGVMLRRLVWALTDIGLLNDAAVIAGVDSRASLNLPMRARERQRHETVLSALTERLGDQSFAQLHARGTALTDDELVDALRRIAAEVEARAPE